MEKILIIEDDKNINEMLQQLLHYNGYETISAYSGTEGILLHSEEVHLILLDLMLPGKNGEDIIKELRAKKPVPIIVMSAIHEVDKKLALFHLGADDYITKPFHNDELLARIKVQLRHVNPVQMNATLTWKDITLHPNAYSVTCKGEAVHLSKIEFSLLKTLMEHPTQVFTKSMLFEKVWDNENSADDNTLNVHISKLRNKLKEKQPNEEYIETVWSIGYRMKS